MTFTIVSLAKVEGVFKATGCYTSSIKVELNFSNVKRSDITVQQQKKLKSEARVK